MLKRLLILLALLLSTPALYAQSTSLTLNVTDSGSVAWGNGTYNLAFVGAPNAKWPGGNITSFSGSLSSAGSVTVSGVPDVNTITPSPSFWKVTVCPNPAISTTQCWISQYTVTGTSLTLNIVPPAISIPVPTTSTVIPPVTAYADAEISGGWVGFQYFQYNAAAPSSSTGRVCQVVTAGACTTWAVAGGGGITSVASLPATCTPGTTANVALNTGALTGQQEYQCGPNANQWYPFNPTLTVSPLTFGAKWDVKAITDASVTNNSNTVTCPNSNCGFTNADLGKIVFATTAPGALTTGCNGAGCGSVVVPQGFICTINNANSINIGTTYPACAADNATANCTVAGATTCPLLWGTQDDAAAINLAAAAAWTGNSCKTLLFPAGMAFFTVPSGGLLSVALPAGSPCAGTTYADATQGGAQAMGMGSSTSVLVPLPSVNFANCTGGVSTTACISGPPNWFGHDFGVWGFGQSGSSTTHNNNLIEFSGVSPSCTAAAAWNLNLSEWQTASTGTKGFALNYGCGVLLATNVVSEGFGNTSCYIHALSNVTTVSALDCFGSSGAAAGASGLIQADSGASVNSTGSMFWGVNPINSAAAVNLNGAGVFNSFGDLIIGASNGINNFGIYMNSGSTGTVNLQGTKVIETNNSGGGNSPLFFCSGSTTCNINAFASTITASGTKMQMFGIGTGTINFFDACSNQFTQGSVANSAINVFGSCSITGTTITAAKLVLSAGWGTTAAWTNLTGSTQQANGTITASGTGQAANPTITYTFPTPFLQTPTGCFALQVGGTQTAVANPFTPSGLSATGVTFTYNGTPVAGNTLVVQIQCWNP